MAEIKYVPLCQHLWSLEQVEYIRDLPAIARWVCVKCQDTCASKYAGEPVAPEKVLYVK